METNFGLECGHIIKTPQQEYFWNEVDKDSNAIEMARYESFINFNKPGNRLWCKDCDDMTRIKRISIYVAEFDTGVTA